MNVANVVWNNFPSFDAFQSLGLSILSLAFVLHIGRAALSAMRGGSIDVVTPLVHLALAAALVTSMRAFGGLLLSLVQGATQSILSGAGLSLFQTAFAKMNSSLPHLGLFELFSMRTLIVLASLSLYVWMYVLKVLMLDLLWPLLFSIVLVLGMVAIPVGLLPGQKAFSGWLKNLIEVCLWPVIFALLASMVCAAFSSFSFATQQISLPQLLADQLRPEDAQQGPAITDLLAFNALCLCYLLSLLFSPVLAMMVTRGTPVGLAAAAMVSAGIKLAVKGAQAAVGAAGGPALVGGVASSLGGVFGVGAGSSGAMAGAVSGASGGSGSSSGSAAGASFTPGAAASSAGLDARNNDPAGTGGGVQSVPAGSPSGRSSGSPPDARPSPSRPVDEPPLPDEPPPWMNDGPRPGLGEN